MVLGLVPEIVGESPDDIYQMMGVYAKNCEEWATTALATMSISGTVIAFYDTLGSDVVEFILNQTELTTISCAREYVDSLIKLKAEGKANYLKNIVFFDRYTLHNEYEGHEGLNIYHID